MGSDASQAGTARSTGGAVSARVGLHPSGVHICLPLEAVQERRRLLDAHKQRQHANAALDPALDRGLSSRRLCLPLLPLPLLPLPLLLPLLSHQSRSPVSILAQSLRAVAFILRLILRLIPRLIPR